MRVLHSGRSLAVLGLAALIGCGTHEPNGPDPNALSLTNTVVTVSRAILFAGDTVTVTLHARNGAGQPFTDTGLTVTFSAEGGTSVGAFLPVLDHHTGTFTAAFVGSSMGTALTVTAQIDGAVVTSTSPTLRVVGFTRVSVSGATMTGAQTTTGGHSCGIITTGEMYCWGLTAFGIRGNGTAGDMTPAPNPTLVSGGHSWSELSAGLYYVCAVAVDGSAFCWGDGDTGELGNGMSGNPPDVTQPGPVSGTTKYQTIATAFISGGCAVTVANAAMCWGVGNYGRLGNGDIALTPMPVAVLGGLNFTAVTTGDGGSCGIATAHAYCWGPSLMLGDSGAVHDTCASGVACAKTPVPLTGGYTFRSIIAQDGNVVCAVATDDKTYCWGSGYLGDGTSEIAWGPRLVSGGLTFTALAGGDGFHCGIASGGAAYCWGANKNGRLRNNLTEALVPTAVNGGHAFTQLSLGQDHACGVATDGNAYCWGGNDKGELGDRTLTASATPVRVRLFN
jgi:hypothetical protein